MFMLLNGLLKSRRQGRRNQGFTLIELLVALVVSSIMISSLLGFMVDIVRKDRNEQVKSATQQEIQAAADYIRRDLETAVYIYDGEGLRAISGNYSTTECTNPQSPGDYTPPASCSQIPVINDSEKTGIPVLAFWKRKFLDKDLNVSPTSGDTTVGCLVKLPGGTKCNDQDYQVYALVVYYLTSDSNNTWSNAMQIRRVELRDGIVDTGGNPQDGEVNSVKYDLQPSPGYANFDLSISGDSIHEKMNKWQKTATAFDLSKTPIQVLVDNIDHTTLADITPETFPNTVNCQGAFPNKDAPSPAPTAPDEPWQSPNYGASDFPTAFNGFKTDSFFTCVDSDAGVAQVYIRGNALARISPTDPDKYEPGNDRVMFFFPTTSMQTKIRGRVE